MTVERKERAKAIFLDAVELDPATRAEMLLQRCGGDAELLREVQSLLASELKPAPLSNNTPVLGSPGPAMREPAANSNATLVLKGRYVVERELGRGGMSVVYLARDLQLLEKRVVVKVLLDEGSQDPWVRQKFQQEMEALARIDHPSVVGVLDSGFTPEGKQFLVVQYIEGVTLRSAIEPGGMDFARVAALVRGIGQGLQAAHDKGVWHRDLKPENIMIHQLGREEHIKLIDFGIAGIKDSQFSGEQTKVAGTLTYMAPEQLTGQSCAASDTYALAVVAWELLSGKAPFPRDSLMHLVEEGTRRRTLLRESRPDLPAAAERSLVKAMSFRPEARHASVSEFSEELWQALTGGEASRKTPILGALEIAHVLFTDLVGYSLLPMDQQREYLAEFQQIVHQSTQFRASDSAGDLVSLPTGDGMALAFFGDPTAPVQCALELAAELKNRPHLKLRMGIHSGPVYRVADINANANVAGGGINMAQRVMDCGDAGHILLSNTVADVLLQLSQWSPYLTDLGECTVKHDVKVHLYNLATSDTGNLELPRKLAPRASSKAARRPVMVMVFALVLVAAAAAVAVWLERGGRGSRVTTDEASIAVLPFADMTPEKNQEYFSDGLAEELMNGLARTPGLRVAGRTSCFQFKGKSESSHEMGKKLNVASLLEGSVRKQGTRVRIAVELVRTVDDSNIWSQTFDREMNDVFAVEDEIARAVSEELKLKLVRTKGAQSAKSPSAEAHNAYLQGQYFYRQRNQENLEKAVGYFQQATKLDPPYASAWVGLAKAYYSQADQGYLPSAEGYRKAREAANRALQLDPDMAEAYAAIGWIEMQYDWNWTEADAALKKALKLEPGNVPALGSVGNLLFIKGRLDQAIATYGRIIEIDPLYSVAFRNLGLYQYSAGQLKEATQSLKKALELAPETSIAHSLLALVYLGQGQPQAALDEANKERQPDYRLQALALSYHALGRKKESDAAFAELTSKFADDPYYIAEVYAFRGEADRAFEWLERAYRERDTGMTEIKVDPLLKSLTRDPRYRALLGKLLLAM